MLPNFLIIGGQRCATGWLAQCLREHPEVFMATDETRFFDTKFENGTDWWEENYFKELCEEEAIGEKTANYLSDEKSAFRIHQTIPEVRLVCSIRNPVDRLYSALKMGISLNPELRNLSLKESLDREPGLINRGRYSIFLKRYFKLFQREKIHILIYEEKQVNPIDFVHSVYDFLGVSVDFLPPSLEVQTKSGAIENSIPVLSGVANKALHPRSPIRRLFSSLRSKLSTGSFSEFELEYLNSVYSEEIDRLEELIGRDLSVWRALQQ